MGVHLSSTIVWPGNNHKLQTNPGTVRKKHRTRDDCKTRNDSKQGPNTNLYKIIGAGDGIVTCIVDSLFIVASIVCVGFVFRPCFVVELSSNHFYLFMLFILM